MKDLICKVLEKIENTYNKESKQIIVNGFKPALINSENFLKLGDSNNGFKIAFIDGGNVEILKSSNFSLQFIRVYYCVYSGCKKIKSDRKEYFVLINIKIDRDNKLEYAVEIVGSSKKYDNIKGEEAEDISSVGDIIRRNMELETCLKVISERVGNLIVLDGCLTHKFESEKKLLEQIQQSSSKNGVSVVGISKTNSIITDSGNNGGFAINKISPQGEWIYSILDNDGAELRIGIVKLHDKSKYVFRIDSFGSFDSVKNLICCSKDPIFRGYPYGLIEADKFARVSNREKELLKIKLMTTAGKQWEKISSLIKSSDAHSILDHVG